MNRQFGWRGYSNKASIRSRRQERQMGVSEFRVLSFEFQVPSKTRNLKLIRSGKETPILPCFHYPLKSYGHRCEPVRDLFLFGSFDHGAEGLFQDAKQSVHDFRFIPEEALQTLDPFEIRDDHAARIA